MLRLTVGEVDWSSRLAAHAAEAHACRAVVVPAQQACALDVGVAFEALQAERGPAPSGWTSAYGIESLGAVEVSARLDGGRIAAIVLCGDLIAPFATPEELAAAMIGEKPTRATADRALLSVLSRPGRFLLGARELGDVVSRLT